jgi:sugar phosphate isomerase/epimerase
MCASLSFPPDVPRISHVHVHDADPHGRSRSNGKGKGKARRSSVGAAATATATPTATTNTDKLIEIIWAPVEEGINAILAKQNLKVRAVVVVAI